MDEQADLPLAGSDTLFGQLQRGRGRGFLRVLDADPPAIHTLLLDCITDDPRWDSQVEHRADYYAQLAMLTQMNLSPLGEYLRTVEDDRLGSETFLTIETLGALARRGNADAIAILRTYVEYGPKWDAALRELAEVSDSAATADLADVICTRFATGQEMEQASTYGLFHRFDSSYNTLWKVWCETHPCIALLLDEARASLNIGERRLAPDYKDLSLDELFAAVSIKNWRQIEKILLSRLQPGDVDRYAAAFATDNLFAWAVAFECLTSMKRVTPFEDLILNELVSYVESTAEEVIKGARLGRISHMLCWLPPEKTLPFARRWLDSSLWYLRVVAGDILEEHATPDDIPHVRAALAQALSAATRNNTEMYRVWSALEILARFLDIGLLSEVEAAFIESDYSFARKRAARAMQANAPTFFAQTYAYECLWDCEEDTRKIGCEGVALTVAGAHERLCELRDDPYEDEDVKQVAGRRLMDIG